MLQYECRRCHQNITIGPRSRNKSYVTTEICRRCVGPWVAERLRPENVEEILCGARPGWDASSAERRAAIDWLRRAHPRWTYARIAQEIEVSTRTIERALSPSRSRVNA